MLVGCAKMFDDNVVGAMQNALLLLNGVDYLAGSQALLSIRAKTMTNRVIESVDAKAKLFWRLFDGAGGAGGPGGLRHHPQRRPPQGSDPIPRKPAARRRRRPLRRRTDDFQTQSDGSGGGGRGSRRHQRDAEAQPSPDHVARGDHGAHRRRAEGRCSGQAGVRPRPGSRGGRAGVRSRRLERADGLGRPRRRRADQRAAVARWGTWWANTARTGPRCWPTTGSARTTP